MKKRRWVGCGAALVLLGACQRDPQVPAVPPLPPPPPAAQAPPKPVEAPRVESEAKPPSELPAPPQVGSSQAAPPPPAAKSASQRKAARKSQPPKRSVEPKLPPEPKAVEAKVTEEKPKEALPAREATPLEEPAAPEPERATPLLGEVITAEERNLYYRELETNLTEARSRLEEAARRRPPANPEDLTRIRSFIQKAQDLRTRDLLTALSLSRRAVTLARELGAASR